MTSRRCWKNSNAYFLLRVRIQVSRVCVNMSDFWLVTVLCLSCTAFSGTESGGVVWRDTGGSVTIQCRAHEQVQELLVLKKGLEQDEIYTRPGNTGKPVISKDFKYRLQVNGKFPNVDILIKNLTSNDTGPYWCHYSKIDPKDRNIINQKGSGSLLLVVTAIAVTDNPCETENRDLFMVSVVTSAAVLLFIAMGFVIWIVIKTKTLRITSVKPRRVTTNDVYEDMRGQHRRS